MNITDSSYTSANGPQLYNSHIDETHPAVGGTKWEQLLKDKPKLIVEACFNSFIRNKYFFSKNHFSQPITDPTLVPDIVDWPHRTNLSALNLDGSAKIYNAMEIYSNQNLYQY